MEYSGHNTSSSDDEIFFGKVKLKEMKQRFGCEKHRQRISCIQTTNEEEDKSLQIIEVKSEPDLLKDIPKLEVDVAYPHTLSSNPSKISNLTLGDDDSFLQLEKMVSELSIPADKTAPELDSTSEVVEPILKYDEEKKIVEKNIDETNYTGTVSTAKAESEIPVTPVTQTYITPYKKEPEAGKYLTLSSGKKTKLPVFQTPLNTAPQKRTTSSINKTPFKANAAYDHVSSPVAAYIKNCPQSPFLKNIIMNKPKPRQTSIPRLVMPTQQSKCNVNNKENVALPVVGYKMAEKVKMVDEPSAKKLPVSHSVKENALSTPRAMILKHEHRKNNTKKKLEGDLSIDLALNQAEMSVCVQKSAIPKPL